MYYLTLDGGGGGGWLEFAEMQQGTNVWGTAVQRSDPRQQAVGPSDKNQSRLKPSNRSTNSQSMLEILRRSKILFVDDDGSVHRGCRSPTNIAIVALDESKFVGRWLAINGFVSY